MNTFQEIDDLYDSIKNELSNDYDLYPDHLHHLTCIKMMENHKPEIEALESKLFARFDTMKSDHPEYSQRFAEWETVTRWMRGE